MNTQQANSPSQVLMVLQPTLPMVKTAKINSQPDAEFVTSPSQDVPDGDVEAPAVDINVARSLKRASKVIQPPSSPSLKRRVTTTLKRTMNGVKRFTRPRSLTLPPAHVVNNQLSLPGSLQSLGERGATLKVETPLPCPPEDFGSVPLLFQEGVPMTKVTSSRRKKIILQLDAGAGYLIYVSNSHKIIPFETIKEIRSGADARFYREQFQLSQDYEDRWLTLSFIIDGDYKILHLVADSAEICNEFESIARQLHAIRTSLMSGLGQSSLRQALWERQYWSLSDQEKDEKLVFSEVVRLCKRLNISSSPEDLSRIFKEADRKNRNYLDFQDFRYFAKVLKARPEVDRLHRTIRSKHGGVFGFSAFRAFMREEQGSRVSDADLSSLFAQYTTVQDGSQAAEDATASFSEPTLTSDAFTAFLLSSDNSVFSDRHGQVRHDMCRPLSEYYVSSSHNTYLIGHQLVGDSTIEGYIRALLHSCRSVEIDIWDGPSPTSEPVIFHGKTLTSKVSLREVCEAIKKYGFVTSPYPVIISAEVHCTLAQQDMIAEIMIQVFGDTLIRAPLGGRSALPQLPSPEELKGRILVKTKNHFLGRSQSIDTPELLSEPSTSSFSDTDASGSRLSLKVARRNSSTTKAKNIIQRVRSVRRASIDRTLSSSPTDTGRPVISTRASDTEKPAMSLALAELLVYTVGVRCRGLNKKEEYAPEHMFSLSEKAMNKLVKSSMMDMVKHNRSHLVRIYPKGLRLSSTNYAPHHYWAAGAQLVAMNWQTSDLGFMINHAMFQRNGRCGYVLKPEPLRIKDKMPLLTRKKHTIDLTIISAQQLPRPKDASGHEIGEKFILNPFVEVSLYVPDWHHPQGDSQQPSQTHSKGAIVRTSVVRNNGFNPVWEERFRIDFESVGDMLDLVFLRFAVRQEDKDDLEPLGLYCVSLGCIMKGYRHLPLHDSKLSQYLFSTLFIRYLLHDG